MSKQSELSNEQLASFCQQLHLILSSSIGITAGMDSIIEGFSSRARAYRHLQRLPVRQNAPKNAAPW